MQLLTLPVFRLSRTSSPTSPAPSPTPFLAAALIAGLSPVKNQLSNVIIMDGKGSQLAVDVAKALRKEGVYQAYVMQVSGCKTLSHVLNWHLLLSPLRLAHTHPIIDVVVAAGRVLSVGAGRAAHCQWTRLCRQRVALHRGRDRSVDTIGVDDAAACRGRGLTGRGLAASAIDSVMSPLTPTLHPHHAGGAGLGAAAAAPGGGTRRFDDDPGRNGAYQLPLHAAGEGGRGRKR